MILLMRDHLGCCREEARRQKAIMGGRKRWLPRPRNSAPPDLALLQQAHLADLGAGAGRGGHPVNMFAQEPQTRWLMLPTGEFFVIHHITWTWLLCPLSSRAATWHP